jgi:hypothetical protein
MITVEGLGAGVVLERVTIEATITRANGTIEHLGIIADSDDNPQFERNPDETSI